ncbi:MAG: fumarylacetoacetase [Acidobacteriota bacterium]|nr:fumarylacetoacetase [Blastocatellia bacterium]MDW8413199.1 fumarylacetoacetase [Acidobacteriota bacterium]
MTYSINYTHDASVSSWVESANSHLDFPIQNLPLGVCRYAGRKIIVTAVGDLVLNLQGVAARGLLSSSEVTATLSSESLNGLMSLETSHWSTLRRDLHNLLKVGADANLLDGLLYKRSEVDMCLPATIGDYTDFYASIYHATNVGSMFRPENPLLPNYKYVPIGYHGRSSSIVVSGTAIRRPCGQTREGGEVPSFGPSRKLDYELEVAFYVGCGNEQGKPIPIEYAEDHIFGLCILNDWSARDIQAWEYQPLGPFLAKSFATTVSPWVVTLEALEPFRKRAYVRPEGDPEPLPYLSCWSDIERGAIDITLEVYIQTEKMVAQGLEPFKLSTAGFGDMYWTIAQMLAHHTCNGCNLRPGDLIASGTVSGAERGSWGSLLELAWRGSRPIELPSGERRSFLEDGDEIIMRGYCVREGFRRIGFGDCRGRILPALK